MEQKRLFTVREAQSILGIKKTLMYKLIKQGSIRTVKLGAQYKIAKEELDRVIAEGASNG